MSVRTLKRSIIRSQSTNTANFRENWKVYHDKELGNRKTPMPKQHHYDDSRVWFAHMKRMKEMIATMAAKKKEEENTTDVQ